MLACLGKVGVNLAQSFIEDRAVLLEAHPNLNAFEGGVVGSFCEDRIADKPFHDEIEANVPFEVAQRPVVEIFDE